MQLFFDCVNEFVVSKIHRNDWDLISDRLYRRYVRWHDLDATEHLLQLVQAELKTLSVDIVDWRNIYAPGSATNLDPTRKTLGQVFSRYFEALFGCIELVKLYGEVDYYFPLRCCITDMLQFIEEKNRPLSDYDNLEGAPFWRS